MAKEYAVRPVSDADIDQIIITRTKAENNTVVYRVRANVKVVIRDKKNADEHSINIPLNKTDVEMGLETQVAAIRDAVLKYAQAENGEPPVVKSVAKTQSLSKKTKVR